MIIYKITNVVNRKIYIGQTVTPLSIRKSGHKHETLKRNDKCAIHKAMRKYGFENFTFEIIDICTTREELNKSEIYWIKELDSRNQKKGYNLTKGGDAPPVMIGKDNPSYGVKKPWLVELNKARRIHPKRIKKTREEINKSISESQKIAWKEGKHSSELFKKFARERIGTINIATAKPIICNETGKLYPSACNAAKSLGISQGNISAQIKGKLNQISGLTFKFQ